MTFEDFDKQFKITYKTQMEELRKDLKKSMLDMFSELAWMAMGRILTKQNLKLTKEK